MIIYSVSFENKIVYIGQSRFTLDIRIRNYKSAIKDRKKKTHIINHLRFHGIEKHVFEIIDTANCREELNNKEIFYIDFYNTLCPNGLNLTYGGDSPIFSKETRQKMSKSRKGKTPWNKNTVGLMGKHWAQGLKLGPQSEETKNKRKRFKESNHFYGKTHTEESKNKISQSLKGRTAWNKGLGTSKVRSEYMSEEHRQKISIKLKGHSVSEQTKIKMSETKRNPVYGYHDGNLKYEFNTEGEARKYGVRITKKLIDSGRSDRRGLTWWRKKR